MAELQALALENLLAGLPGLAPSFASLYYEALLICLDHHAHESGVLCEVRALDASLATPTLRWSGSLDDRTRRAWGEARNAVEDAAAGVACLTMPAFTEYTVIECANIGDGIDYWLGYRREANQHRFQRRARLEASGILHADRSSRIRQRVNDKLEQTKRSDYTGLPAYVVVSEFSRPLIVLERRG